MARSRPPITPLAMRVAILLSALTLGACSRAALPVRRARPQQLNRRAALVFGCSSATLLFGNAPSARAEEEDRVPTQAQQTLGSLNAGAKRLSEAGVEEGDLVAELLRRTEANKERNAALVKKTTEANAFTAIDGAVDRRLVTDLSGKNIYLDAQQIRALTQQRRLACAPSVMEPCRMINPAVGTVRQLVSILWFVPSLSCPPCRACSPRRGSIETAHRRMWRRCSCRRSRRSRATAAGGTASFAGREYEPDPPPPTRGPDPTVGPPRRGQPPRLPFRGGWRQPLRLRLSRFPFASRK